MLEMVVDPTADGASGDQGLLVSPVIGYQGKMPEMMEAMGLPTLSERFKDPEIKRTCEGMFPMDVPKNTRFAINYFTSIGLGAITEEMREYLKVSNLLLSVEERWF